MIAKIANSPTAADPGLNSPEKVEEKLDYYRSLFGKIHDLSEADFNTLKDDIRTFFNCKPVSLRDTPPERLIRISNNTNIFAAQGKELSYFTDINQLLAPPIDKCNFGRCNMPEQRVLYCAIDEASAYWETKPKKGDVISISQFKRKEGAKINCSLIRKEKTEEKAYFENDQQRVFHLLEDFFIDVFSLEVARNRPKDYLFSASLTDQFLFYPIPSPKNIQAIIYPSVQKKQFGHNFAIPNSLVFEKYDLVSVETRFILEEYDDINPESDELTTERLISSFGTTDFDFINGKILYNEHVDKIFQFFRNLQMSKGAQTRIEADNIVFNLSLSNKSFKANPSKI